MYFLQKDDIMLHFTLNGIFRYHWLSMFTFLFTWKVLRGVNLDLIYICRIIWDTKRHKNWIQIKLTPVTLTSSQSDLFWSAFSGSDSMLYILFISRIWINSLPISRLVLQAKWTRSTKKIRTRHLTNFLTNILNRFWRMFTLGRASYIENQ